MPLNMPHNLYIRQDEQRTGQTLRKCNLQGKPVHKQRLYCQYTVR